MRSYLATFKTTDLDIVSSIPNEQVTDFYYDERTGCGRCYLRYGISSIDLMKIAQIGLKNNSELHLCVTHIKSGIEQFWELKDGKSVAYGGR